jgi:hypothetical protein
VSCITDFTICNSSQKEFRQIEFAQRLVAEPLRVNQILIHAFMSEIMSKKKPRKVDRSELSQYHATYSLRFGLPPEISS